jgi:biotin transporter BioY
MKILNIKNVSIGKRLTGLVIVCITVLIVLYLADQAAGLTVLMLFSSAAEKKAFLGIFIASQIGGVIAVVLAINLCIRVLRHLGILTAKRVPPAIPIEVLKKIRK